MSLLRWDMNDMERLKDDMTRMWGRMREDWNLDQTRPHTHMHQLDHGYLAEFELPGVNPELVNIEVDEEAVMVQGEFPACPGEVDARAGRPFHVVVSWPTEINPDTAEAAWRHGLLSITAQKAAGHRRRISLHDIQPQ
ncbi:Hsp20/alpha crystallin family protein [Sulfobacillus harzensis]|uniref:Hsp20/alpha crystallin family protein n=1 Tax=Sulfobacillus harzensis TaxID=2729629 RepID=A0A7Y0Q2J0_9FIRM|nr:Hsp20/alpha crystallin family protein [Sulfobacillus harzensis]NMP21214.1 Hsp20/alpha crystallin family protein [Sulfobacillus harzensis]